MPYTYPADAQAMFEDRAHQFVALGLPVADVEGVRAVTTDFWADAPGGWVFEWSALAERYVDEEQPALAALAYGAAKFPCLADEARRTAAAHQLEQYLSAAPSFPVHFERRIVTVQGPNGSVDLPVHLYAATADYAERPVVILSGGVDTFKMDLHPWSVALAEQAGVTVLAVDLPGTGENPVPLGPAADDLIRQLVTAARALGNGLVGHFGTSFGGNLSAMTGLTGIVDAAVVLGGPVGESLTADHLRRLPYGMPDIVGNAMGFEHPVTVSDLAQAGSPLVRTGLLEQNINAPMLVINGIDDYFVPASDVLVFQGRSGTETHRLEGAGHCAMSRSAEVLRIVIGWLRVHLDIPAHAPLTDTSTRTGQPAAVLIVGAGPVGLVLACELARRGIPIRVVDRLAAPTEQSRAIVVHPRSLEMLRRVGVVDEIIASGMRSTGLTVHVDDQVLADVGFESIDSVYRFSVITAQTETERILTERLSDLGVRVDRSVELVSFEQDASGVHYLVQHADGRSEAATADWVVGTDGSHSTVRDLMGEALEGSFKGERFLLGDVDAEYALPHDRSHLFFHPDGPLLVFPMLGQRVRVIAQVDGGDQVASTQLLEQLARQRGVALQVVAARWLTIFEIHHAQVPQYRTGRAFLAGDAAHVHSPAGGQGMNTGMQDAFNLGWKLAAVIHGSADPTILDTYHDERHPTAAKVIKQTTALTTMATLPRPAQRAIRNLAVRGVGRLPAVQHTIATQVEEVSIAYPDSRIVAGGAGRRRGVRPGSHAPDVPGTDLGPRVAGHCGHVALVFGAVAPDMAAALNGLPRLVVKAPGAASNAKGSGEGSRQEAGVDVAVLDDAGGAVRRRYGRQSGDVVLVRPDGYVGLVAASEEHALVKEYRTYVGVG